MEKCNSIPIQHENETCQFLHLLDSFITFCQNDGLSEKTILDYRDKISKFRWWWLYHYPSSGEQFNHPRGVTEDQASAYAGYLRQSDLNRWGLAGTTERLSTASIASYGRTIKVFFHWLFRKRHIASNPFDDVNFNPTKKLRKRIIKRLEDADLVKIFDALRAATSGYISCRNLAMVSLLLDSGIRRGELLSIRLDGLDLEHCRATVSGKTGERFAFFSVGCRRALADYLDQYRGDQGAAIHPLWLTENGDPLSYGGFGMVIRRLEKASGIDFHPHKLRHTYATIMARAGVNVYDLKELMGHSSISTTMIYIQQDVERLGEVGKQNSPLDRLNNKTN
ncbi:MAG: tyrosine-type recombinase/integrase [Chloroflexi bacterium]|nr:tyrosine-type recombinase/integrase [Chloroflexota bacterium]NWJ96718.1 tyrosine-type recombinase/integrase [Chloroflexota bacterium]